MSLIPYPNNIGNVLSEKREYLTLINKIEEFKSKNNWEYTIKFFHTPLYNFNKKSLFRSENVFIRGMDYYLPNHPIKELLETIHQREFLYYLEELSYLWRRNKKKMYINWDRLSQYFYFPRFINDFIDEFIDVNDDSIFLLYENGFTLINKHYPTRKIYNNWKLIWLYTIKGCKDTKNNIQEDLLSEMKITSDFAKQQIFSIRFDGKKWGHLLIDWIPISQLKYFI